VRVEVDDGDRAVRGVHRPQQRERDRVIAAEGQQSRRPLEQVAGAALDFGDGLADVERVDADVARVRDLAGGERRHPQGRVVRAQQPGGLPDVTRAEAGAGPVADPGIERDAEDRDVGPRHVAQPRQPGERRLAAVPRHDRGVDLADDPVDGDARLGPGQRPTLGLAVGLALRLAFRHSLNSR
jgi:hypothetical protein